MLHFPEDVIAARAPKFVNNWSSSEQAILGAWRALELVAKVGAIDALVCTVDATVEDRA